MSYVLHNFVPQNSNSRSVLKYSAVLIIGRSLIQLYDSTPSPIIVLVIRIYNCRCKCILHIGVRNLGNVYKKLRSMLISTNLDSF